MHWRRAYLRVNGYADCRFRIYAMSAVALRRNSIGGEVLDYIEIRLIETSGNPRVKTDKAQLS